MQASKYLISFTLPSVLTSKFPVRFKATCNRSAMSSAMESATIGYPRIGPNREMKKCLEGYWSGVVAEAALRTVSDEIGAQSVSDQASAGVDLVGVGDHTLYDSILDWMFRLGLVPARFSHVPAGLDQYFAMARGVDGAGALDMSKFIGTNYHYLVPEFNQDSTPKPTGCDDFVKEISAAQASIGADRVSPIVMGPVTIVYLAKLTGVDHATMVERLVPEYVKLLSSLKGLAVKEVQMHEPILVTETAYSKEIKGIFESAYSSLAEVGLPINLVTYFDDIAPEVFPWVAALPGLSVLSLDFTRGNNVATLKACGGFPQQLTLGAGIVDGRSVWSDVDYAPALLNDIRQVVGPNVTLRVQPSSSLMFLPLDLEAEEGLPAEVKHKLEGARQKLASLVKLARSGSGASQSAGAAAKSNKETTIPEELFVRKPSFAERRPQQFTVSGGFGTNTIGSFPQTPELRSLRLRYKKGRISETEYNAEIDKEIASNIAIQRTMGLDTYVHGEPERSDMVEYFGQCFAGVTFTTAGWVQSYGSRYVRPPIFYGDVKRTSPMTVREFAVAQELSGDVPVKGMLTAATTILNWSFPRKDISRGEQAYQVGLALRDEVQDLEAAGCRLIQVDDPAIREGLPLKKKDWAEYLNWAVRAFRVSTAGVRADTQIWSHLCYSDFEDIMQALDDMDVDVLTVENSRSGDEMLRAFAAFGYSKDIGPGVYDIHSYVVPTKAEIDARITMIQNSGFPADRIWINPDCGLKTRKWKEVKPSLVNMVAAAVEARAKAVGA